MKLQFETIAICIPDIWKISKYKLFIVQDVNGMPEISLYSFLEQQLGLSWTTGDPTYPSELSTSGN